VRAIERQLAGIKVTKDPKILSYFSEDTLPEQRRLIETMILAPPAETIEAERQRRNNAINAVRRTAKSRRGTCAEAESVVVVKKEDSPSLEDKALEAAMLSVYVKHPQQRPTVCFMCLGNENLAFDSRVYSFSRPGDLSRQYYGRPGSDMRGL
jgi:Protein of unknown function (DUF3435)